MFRTLLSTVVLALLVVPRAADACSCMFSSPCRTYASADAVFAGDVLEVTEGPVDGPPRPKLALLRVGRAFKGAAGVGQVVTVEMPGGSSASCSLDIIPGSRVVIYSSVKAGRFFTSLCQGSYSLEAEAPWPTLPPPGGVVSGHLMRPATEVRDAPRPIAGVLVSIDASGRRISSQTDSDGRFRLTGVPAGIWTLQFDLGPTELADKKVELQSAEDCAEVYASPRPAG
jgi:hypothetical protein